MAGRPVGDVKPVLAAAWTEVNDATLTEPHLTAYAEAISEGKRVVMTVEEPEL